MSRIGIVAERTGETRVAATPDTVAKIRGLGYEVVALDMSEYRKMDGGLSCLSVRW